MANPRQRRKPKADAVEIIAKVLFRSGGPSYYASGNIVHWRDASMKEARKQYRLQAKNVFAALRRAGMLREG